MSQQVASHGNFVLISVVKFFSLRSSWGSSENRGRVLLQCKLLYQMSFSLWFYIAALAESPNLERQKSFGLSDDEIKQSLLSAVKDKMRRRLKDIFDAHKVCTLPSGHPSDFFPCSIGLLYSLTLGNIDLRFPSRTLLYLLSNWNWSTKDQHLVVL